MKREGKKLVGASPQEIERMRATWDKCNLWLNHKQRFCRLQKISNYLYCGEHLPKEGVVLGGREMQRVPCPLDPSHTCFLHLVNKHVAKCKPKGVCEESKECIKLNVNLRQEENVDNIWSQVLNLAELSDSQYGDLLCRIIKLHECHELNPKDDFSIHPMLCQELCKSDIGDNAAKHLSQVGSILSIIEKNGLLLDNTTFIEYGGGRGSITYYLGLLVAEKKLDNCNFIVVDKASPRHKKDNKLADLGIKVKRIKADIKDLIVGELPGIAETKTQNIVGVAKHLCGSATDMSIFSLLDQWSNTRRNQVLGFVMATCCHHKCEYMSFYGTPFINANFKPGEFHVLTQMSSWAVDGDDGARIDGGRNLNMEALSFISQLEGLIPNLFLKRTIGNMVKNILDYSRISAIPDVDLAYSKVVNYTDSFTTLENRAVVATLRKNQ